MTTDRDTATALLVRFGKEVNAGNVDGILACVTPISNGARRAESPLLPKLGTWGP